MPCYDSREDLHQICDDLQKSNNKLEAMLCMVMYTLEEENEIGHFAELFNYKESGITRDQLFGWWKQHKEDDRRRKDRERAERDRLERRDAALAKLTDEERKLLGVK
jgi:hypothetical protein